MARPYPAVTCHVGVNGGLYVFEHQRAPFPVMRNGPVKKVGASTPSRTTLAASDPGVGHPQIPVFLGRNRRTTLSALKRG